MGSDTLDRQLQRLASPLAVLLCIFLLTSTALTNICMLLLVCLSVWAWTRFQWPAGEWALVKQLFVLIGLFCAWDLIANLLGENSRRLGINYAQNLMLFSFLPVR